MKKKFLFFEGTAFLALSLCVSLSACGSDDDDAPEVKDGSYAPAGVVAVDLGLPSGTKWANVNLGASKPEDTGDYFAWGEIVGYSLESSGEHFAWSNYQWGNGDESSLTKYGFENKYGKFGVEDNLTILSLEDDAAHVIWGGNWHIPTSDDIKELVEKCTWTWVKHGDTNGYEIKGANGKSIFIPAAGERSGNEHRFLNTGGRIWTSTLASDDPRHAQYLLFYGGEHSLKDFNRYYGLTIRPVTK